MAKIKIAIDSGHGSNTPGKRTAPFTNPVDVEHNGTIDIQKGEQFKEHHANTGIANLLYSELMFRGYDVIRTGFNDSNSCDDLDEPLSTRQKRIKAERCDISISVHFNASGGDGMSFNSAEGAGIYIHNKNTNGSKELAVCVLNEIAKGSNQKNRGVSPQGLALCNCKIMGTTASILVEVAFMTNEREAQQLMATSKFWAETAIEISDGVDKYVDKFFLIKPAATISQRSSTNDIQWLQNKLNKALRALGSTIILEVNGIYDELTRYAVLVVWELWGWNKDKKDTGWKSGSKTISKLDEY